MDSVRGEGMRLVRGGGGGLKRGFLSSTVSSANCCSVEVLEQNVTARGLKYTFHLAG